MKQEQKKYLWEKLKKVEDSTEQSIVHELHLSNEDIMYLLDLMFLDMEEKKDDSN